MRSLGSSFLLSGKEINMKFVGVNLERWSTAAYGMFQRKRIYIRGHWTPFVILNFRKHLKDIPHPVSEKTYTRL